MISAADVKELRELTGAGMMDAKHALAEAKGDLAAAQDILRIKGQAKADKKASRTAREGRIGSYIHTNGKIGVLVEVRSETDFVAKNAEFQHLVAEIALHIAAANPRYISADDIPADVLKKEQSLIAAQVAAEGKPAAVAKKIIAGKLAKFQAETALLTQPSVRDPEQTVGEMLTAAIAKIGENISVARFVRFEVGEEQ